MKNNITDEGLKYVENLAMTTEKAEREGNISQKYDTTTKLVSNILNQNDQSKT